MYKFVLSRNILLIESYSILNAIHYLRPVYHHIYVACLPFTTFTRCGWRLTYEVTKAARRWGSCSDLRYGMKEVRAKRHTNTRAKRARGLGGLPPGKKARTKGPGKTIPSTMTYGPSDLDVPQAKNVIRNPSPGPKDLLVSHRASWGTLPRPRFLAPLGTLSFAQLPNCLD